MNAILLALSSDLETVPHITRVFFKELFSKNKTIPTILQVGRKGLASTSFNLISNIQHPVQSGFYASAAPSL